MEERTIHYICNDVQYYDRTKDGISMNERSFINFIKELIRDYGNKIGNNIFISLQDIPYTLQQQYLKQFYFFENQLERYQEIFNNPHLVRQAIEEDCHELEYWLTQYVEEVEQEIFESYLEENHLRVSHHLDNGEPYPIRRI
jgi:hypothetical protein